MKTLSSTAGFTWWSVMGMPARPNGCEPCHELPAQGIPSNEGWIMIMIMIKARVAGTGAVLIGMLQSAKTV